MPATANELEMRAQLASLQAELDALQKAKQEPSEPKPARRIPVSLALDAPIFLADENPAAAAAKPTTPMQDGVPAVEPAAPKPAALMQEVAPAVEPALLQPKPVEPVLQDGCETGANQPARPLQEGPAAAEPTTPLLQEGAKPMTLEGGEPAAQPLLLQPTSPLLQDGGEALLGEHAAQKALMQGGSTPPAAAEAGPTPPAAEAVPTPPAAEAAPTIIQHDNQLGETQTFEDTVFVDLPQPALAAPAEVASVAPSQGPMEVEGVKIAAPVSPMIAVEPQPVMPEKPAAVAEAVVPVSPMIEKPAALEGAVPSSPAPLVAQQPDERECALNALRAKVKALEDELVSSKAKPSSTAASSKGTWLYESSEIDGEPLDPAEELDAEMLQLIKQNSGPSSVWQPEEDQEEAVEVEQKINFSTHRNAGMRLNRFMQSKEGDKFPHMKAMFETEPGQTLHPYIFI